MSTSPLGGRTLSGFGLNAGRAIGTSIARDYALNNLLHYADEYAQVRIAWTGTVTALNSNADEYFTPRTTSLTANLPFPIASFGPFPVSLRANGDSYPMRIRVAGSNSLGAGSVYFRVVICPAFSATVEANYTAADYVYDTATTSSATAAWLTGASQGPNAYETMVQIPGDVAASWMRTTSTLSDVAGEARGVDQCLVSANVFAYTTNTSAIGQLNGLYLAEYVGL